MKLQNYKQINNKLWQMIQLFIYILCTNFLTINLLGRSYEKKNAQRWDPSFQSQTVFIKNAKLCHNKKIAIFSFFLIFTHSSVVVVSMHLICIKWFKLTNLHKWIWNFFNYDFKLMVIWDEVKPSKTHIGKYCKHCIHKTRNFWFHIYLHSAKL